MRDEKQKQIIDFINEEIKRVNYGKLFIEITITKGEAVNIQGETRKSERLVKDN